jgi:hypothetical protein
VRLDLWIILTIADYWLKPDHVDKIYRIWITTRDIGRVGNGLERASSTSNVCSPRAVVSLCRIFLKHGAFRCLRSATYMQGKTRFV